MQTLSDARFSAETKTNQLTNLSKLHNYFLLLSLNALKLPKIKEMQLLISQYGNHPVAINLFLCTIATYDGKYPTFFDLGRFTKNNKKNQNL